MAADSPPADGAHNRARPSCRRKYSNQAPKPEASGARSKGWRPPNEEGATPKAAGAIARRRQRENSHQGKVSAPIVASDYMTTTEAAAYLKLSRQFLEGARYRGDGSGPAYIKLERAVRYRRSVLDAWMAAHDHSPDKPSLTK